MAKTLPEQISQSAQVVLQTLAYAGTGDVLQIQSLLAMCGEHTEVDESATWKVTNLQRHKPCFSCTSDCPAQLPLLLRAFHTQSLYRPQSADSEGLGP